MAAVLVPLLLWMDARNLSLLVASPWAFSLALGRLLGVMGICFYSINLILSSRWRFIEALFGGLNRVYIAHHIIGGIALIMLLFHPIVLAIARASSSWYGSLAFLLPSTDIAKNLGILALTGMVLLLILTFYIKLPYGLWKFTHKFLGLFFVIALLHILLINSGLTSNLALKAYIFGLATIGLIAFIYRTLLPRVFVRTYDYTVKSVKLLKPNVVEVAMVPKTEQLSFKPGQFIFISFVDSSQVSRESHPFSIESADNKSHITIVAKMIGDYTKTLSKLEVGTRARIEGAYGGFSYTDFPATEQIWIAGGIGITPYVAMARHLIKKPQLKVDLYYSCKTKDEFLYLDTLFADLIKKNPNFRLIKSVSDQEGFLNADKIVSTSGEVIGKEIFICGPPGMMQALSGQLIKKGVKKNNIHSEEFSIQ